MTETTVTTTADVMETIERAAKPKSKQPRYAANAASFFGAVSRWIKSAKALEQPDYATDSRRRDAWLLDFWRLEPHLAGVLNSVITINANRGWTMTGGRNQVYRYTSVLHDQAWAGPSLNGWRPYFTVQSLSYYATDLGTVSEVGRQGKRGPLRALYHTDPSRCKLTGKVKTPLAYYPRSGKRQAWTPDDYFRLCSMPSAQEKYLNLGFSAVSRCLELAKMMVGLLEHDQEMIGARMPKGLLLLQGISETQWEQALKARDAKQDSLERLYFGGVMTLATAGLEQLDARLVALSQLPAGFDKKMFMDLLMYGYALAFGYDPSEFWPVQYGAMGRGTEVETQHRKATGKGGLEFTLAYQENLQRLLPDTLEFTFEQRDEEGQLLAAQVAQAWAKVAETLYEAGQMMGAGPLLMRDQALSLLAEAGTIPPEWSEIEEEEKVSDVDEPERKRRRDEALVSPTVRRAALLFPAQPIVRYHYPTGREDVLWDSGADALTPSVWRGWRAVDDESDVLWRDPDGEFSITEGDVDKAIEAARRRVGPEFAALLEAKTEVEAEAEEEGEEEERGSLRDTIAQGVITELHKQMALRRGGPGSGHHGHAGRPGEVGGSAPDGGGAGLSGLDGARLMEQYFGEDWHNASEEERALLKAAIVKSIADETGLSEAMVNRAIAEWAQSAGDERAYALWMQDSAAKEFGLTQSEFLSQKIGELGVEIDPRQSLKMKLGFERVYMDDTERRLYLRTMYDHTQSGLADAGLGEDDVVTMFRGVKFRSSEIPDWVAGDTFPVSHSALSSWSLGQGQASRFAHVYDEGWTGLVLKADIPVKSILSTPRTGSGCLTEGEVVILGLDMDSEIIDVNKME